MLQIRSPEAVLTEFATVLQDAAVFVAVAAVIFLPGRYLVVPGARWLMDAANVDDTLELPLLKVLDAGFALFAVFTAITVSGVASFLATKEAITAGATIAIGFASQDVLGNLVSGVFIVLDPTYNIGDWIQWKDKEGIIEDISFRVTRIHTFDNELVTVPNSELTKNTITNPVAKERLRVTFPFGVGYEDDLERAQAIIVEAALAHDEILDRPGPSVRIQELGDSAVILESRFWIDTPARTDFIRIRSEFVENVKAQYDAEGISLPAPQRELSGSIETTEQVVGNGA
ncbi:mechanosensitive ion channel family protein [Haloarchaeobius amylolyticus]|uniref:mechanosensitive ion channel family protein n=1 Tax=Haloarchaeobius amylolyticus TaxID=1198296 RepID=UPI00226DB1F2|nr:mechanosensitive ion channel family protein [Haloarchaeobius amylolyticus]